VLSVPVVESRRYPLSAADAFGESFDAARWENAGPGELRLLERKRNRECRAVLVAADGETVLNHHLVHPDTVFTATDDACGRMFWTQDVYSSENPVDTCLKIVFESASVAADFVSKYRECQCAMFEIHRHSESEWHRPDVEYEFTHAAREKEESPVAGTIALPQEYGVAVEEGFATDADEEEGDSDDSEISLESFPEEEMKPRRDLGPELDGVTDWRCQPCRTMNPAAVDICMACDAPRGSPAEQAQNQAESQPENTFSFNIKKIQPPEENNSALDFSSGGGGEAFSFGNSTSFCNDSASKPSFSFGAASSVETSNFSFGSSNASGTFSFESSKHREEKAKEEHAKPKSTSAYPPMETMKKMEQGDRSKPKISSSYPPMETMKKVEQVDPSKQKAPSTAAYPPMETMKKVEQVDPSKPKALSTAAYPPMETMKKVEQVDPSKPKISSSYPPMETMKKMEHGDRSKQKTPSAAAYPPMETMKKVEQTDPSKPKASSPYPPMESMKKVEQVNPGTASPLESKKDAGIFGFGVSQTSFGASPQKSGAGLFGSSASSSTGLFSSGSVAPAFDFSQTSGTSLGTGGSLFGSTSQTSLFGTPLSAGFGSSYRGDDAIEEDDDYDEDDDDDENDDDEEIGESDSIEEDNDDDAVESMAQMSFGANVGSGGFAQQSFGSTGFQSTGSGFGQTSSFSGSGFGQPSTLGGGGFGFGTPTKLADGESLENSGFSGFSTKSGTSFADLTKSTPQWGNS